MAAHNMVCIALRVLFSCDTNVSQMQCLIPSILLSEMSVTTIHTEPLAVIVGQYFS